MKLRAPSVPLITVDPYFSVWSMDDTLNGNTTKHWTGSPNTLIGSVIIDGEEFVFMGESDKPKIKQTNLDITALSSTYTFCNDKIELTIAFTTPLLIEDLYLLTRPVSYMKAIYKSVDGNNHKVKVNVLVSEEICLNKKGESEVISETISLDNNVKAVKIGNKTQNVLNRSGDDLRIDWGYFYLATSGCCSEVSSFTCEDQKMTYVMASSEICSCNGALFAFAYDDIYSMVYFNEKLKSYWNKDGETIEQAIVKALAEYDNLILECDKFSKNLFCEAVKAGGEKYAEILELAYRQVLAAHKLVLDKDGNILYVSKECFSNGCAATVDVSYPSIPMFLYYNPELIKGMMRPIFKFSTGGVWPFDFAPHDVGQYPLLNGQVYSGTDPSNQMPVEECGNMLIMAASVAIAQNDTSFISEYMGEFKKWAKYLFDYGIDPENQLCTDDFAGHLAHNCNLALKAIMGIAGFSIVYDMLGDKENSKYYLDTAKSMAETWVKTASNGDGSYRLAFDRPNTFSMKYNVIWDKIFGTNIFPKEVIKSEFASCTNRVNPYGMPLDNRATYTKSDWLVWTATLADEKDDFIKFIEPLWNAYNYTPSRVPMSDWYQTITSQQVGFQNRTVQGGLFIKLLHESGKLLVK